MKIPERLEALRERMAALGLGAYIVPSTDPHQSEYVAKAWQRRTFISGFTGSAGTVVVTAERAGLWTDSRYFLQAEQQLAGSGIDLFRIGEPDVPEIEPWLGEQLEAGAQVGVDAWVFSSAAYARIERGIDEHGLVLTGVDADLVEMVWGEEKPDLPDAAVRPHPIEYAGQPAADKVARLRKAIAEAGVDTLILAALDEVAWLLNMRGADVAYNPVFIAYVVVDDDRIAIFVDPDKLDDEARATLPEGAMVLPYETFEAGLAELGDSERKVWIDPGTVSQRVAASLERAGAEVIRAESPVPAWKAAKNSAEVEGMRAAHLRDGVALVRFLRWLSEAVPAGGQSELSVARRLEEFRSELDHYRGPSFATISGYGPHGAIVHYSVTEDSDVPLAPEGLLLIDSGGQYSDGTTDVTRTLALGPPTPDQRRAYTAVLLGHLRLTRAQFPVGTDGYQLDVLARAPLWAAGLNYGHGTGHGVGAALCVHEGPFSVSTRKVLTPLQAGNVLSIEPGFYEPKGFGIRVENLALVVDRGQTPSGAFLGFDTLTLCPYGRELIDTALLSDTDRKQVNDYHAKVLEQLGPLLDEPDARWLADATRPL